MSGTVVFTKNLGDGAFQIDATLEEEHSGQLSITRNPVEKGSQISDHAQVLPKQFSLTAGVSNLHYTWTPDKVKAAHQQLVQLQESRKPFTVVTGLTVLKNMLIERFSNVRDKETANVYIVKAHLTEVIVVGTKTTSSQLRPAGDDSDTVAQDMGSPNVGRGDVQTKRTIFNTKDNPRQGIKEGLSSLPKGAWKKSQSLTDPATQEVLDIGWGGGG